MSENVAKFAKGQQRRSDRAQKDSLRPEERKALWTLRKEAKAAGSFLASGGKGGLPPSTVLGAMRKAKYKCKMCGELGNDENGGLSIHHKFQHIQDPKARAKGERANKEGRRNEESQIVPTCDRCHNALHEKDRAENPGEPDADEAMKEGEEK